MPLRGIRWGSVLISALSALISLALGLWVWDFVAGLFARGGWLGSVALVLAALAGVSALMIASREIAGLWRLGRVATFREQAASVLRGEGSKPQALETSAGVERLFAGRAEAAWGLRRLSEHRGDVLDAREVLILTERELLTPLDAGARALIAVSMRRVSVVTAVSPSALVDVGFVAFANLRMLRQLATLYGGRPGMFGVLRLARLVAGHLLLTGGMAVGEDVLQQLAGHGLTARLSARLGEGLMNGAFTGRIGVAAVELCRPLPFIEAERPRLRDLVTELRSASVQTKV
jgi:putative membrane protein